MQYYVMDNENNMIQWTIRYNVQYSMIAYNITIQNNRKRVQYQTIDYNTMYNNHNMIQYTMDTIYNVIQYDTIL